MPPVELRVCGLRKTFLAGGREVDAVRDVSFTANAGSFTGIVGPSGCGKTTLLRLIAGLEKSDAGNTGFGDGQSAPRFAVMFQDARLLPWLTVAENLRLAFSAKSAREADADINNTLELVGLADWKRAYPRRLSGGMAQRVSLARALCRKPDILLLDEPFSALDAFTRKQLRGELAALWRQLNVTVIMVTHDIEEAVELSDRVLCMERGAVRCVVPVDIPKPRDYRSPEFQSRCRAVENGFYKEILTQNG
jgi:ABC-type nitrate/sulfonate/bicarbonate transport system ATPase subunit